jgi:hypothetical protein
MLLLQAYRITVTEASTQISKECLSNLKNVWQGQNTSRQPPRIQCIKLVKLKERPQKVRDAINVGCPLKKGAGSVQSQSIGETMWVAGGKATGAGFSKHLRAHFMTLCVKDGVIGFNFCFSGFGSCFSLIPHCYLPISPSGNRDVNCFPHYYMQGVCKFFKDFFSGFHIKQFALSIRGNFALRFLRDVGTVETLGTLGDGLNEL